ncbi:hypothetical protein B0E48_12295 [Rhodanobacter sp. C03]|nr:hypothetical protein B0E48_12295 [Rhodanobacter sp. C03]
MDTIEYSDNLSAWVLGQVSRTTTNGVEVSRTSYDPVTALPIVTYNFGELKQSFTYNADGTVASVSDGNSNITGLQNYMRGLPQEIDFPATPDQPAGTKVTISVDNLGQVQWVVDARGAKTCYGYDAMGRVNLIQYPSETVVGQCGGSWNQTQISFSSNYPAADGLPAGQWRQRATTGNLMTETLYDGLWRPVVQQSYDVTNVNATISQVVTRYDLDSNPTFVSYPQRTVDSAVTNTWADPTQAPNALGTTTVYDALDRVTSATQSAESGVQVKTTTSYLPGFKTQITDPNNNVTTISYLTYDQPTTDWPMLISAPAGVTQTIARDVFGSPTSINQSGLYNGTENDSVTKTMVYDIYHRLCRTTEPESGDSSISYDGADNIRLTAQGLALTESGCARDQVPSATTTVFTYDAMNRVKTITPPTGAQSSQYTYDAAGNVTWLNSGNSVWNGVYNYRNMLTGESLNQVGQVQVSMGYAYDTNGHLTLLQYPGGEQVSYAPDPRGQPTLVATNNTSGAPSGFYASSVSYFPNQQVASFLFANGSAYVADQNARQLLSDFSYATGTGALNVSESYTYDSDANIAHEVDLANAGTSRSKYYAYDGLNRLTEADAAGLWGSSKYTYDALNNLRTVIKNGVTSTYTYDPTNRLSSISGGVTASFQYDTRRNVSNKNGVTYTFDQKDQLTQIQGLDSFLYDGNGRRTIKTSSSGDTVFSFYNHSGQLMYQSDAGSSTATNYIYLGTKLIAKNANEQLAAPGAITFDSNPNNGNYTVSWGATARATSYVLEESANGGAWTVVNSGSGTSVAFTNKGSGGYVYQVQGCDNANHTCSPWTTSATLGVTPSLPTVTVPTGTINGSYSVSWTAPAGATSYAVQESLNGGAWTTIASNTTATSISRPGTTYGTDAYQVSASNAYGNRGWTASAFVYVLPPPGTVSFSANPNNGNYTVSWGAVSAATSYTLQESVNGGAWTMAYTGSGTSAAMVNKPGGGYVYQVQACEGGDCGGWTVSATLGVTPALPTGITVPSSLTFAPFTVSWTAPTGATSYTVQQSFNGGAWTTIANAITTSSYSVTSAPGGTYTFQVSASNAYGSRGWMASAPVSVTQVPAPPTNLVASSSGGKIVLTWDAMQWATTYAITVYGTHGSLGEYLYNVATNSFNMPSEAPGTYSFTISACSIAGCSAAVSNNGGPFNFQGAGDVVSPGKAIASKVRSVLGMDSGSSEGCSATQCTAVAGGSP